MTREEILEDLKMSDLDATDTFNDLFGTSFPAPLGMEKLEVLHKMIVMGL